MLAALAVAGIRSADSLISRLFGRFVIGLLCLGCAACHSAPQPEIEVVSDRQQTLEVLRDFPLSFPVKKEQERHAWIRATLFMKKFSGKTEIKAQGGTRPSEILSNQSSGEPYIYKIERYSSAKHGSVFSVSCQATGSGSPYSADLNARNLARFIRDGILEESLVEAAKGAPASLPAS